MFDFQPGDPTWEAVERRRKLAEALGMQAMGAAPTTFGGGLSALGAALGGALAGRGAERMDARRAELGDTAFEAALGGIPQDNSPLAAALGGVYGAPVSASVPPAASNPAVPLNYSESPIAASVDPALGIRAAPEGYGIFPNVANGAAGTEIRQPFRHGYGISPGVVGLAGERRPAGRAPDGYQINPLAANGAAGAEIRHPFASGEYGIIPGQSGNRLRDGIIETARAIGADPLDLATAISYETAGTFDPTKAGPTTQWGQHRGLIQFGEPQAKQYGVDWSDPIGSQLGANGAIANYFRDRGFKPGMSGMDLYSTINAGSPGRYSASDANNGGAPGTVADKWSQQMAPHREKALSLLGGDYQPAASAAPGLTPMSLPAPPPVNVALIRAMNNPYMTPEQKQILGGIYQQQMAMQITPYQQAQLAMQQQKMAFDMQPEPVKPVVVNDRLVNPQTGALIADYSDAASGQGGTEYGLSPQYGVDANGNPTIIQIGKNGTAVQTAMPDGVTFQKEPIKLDAGTHWVLLDPISRQPVGQVPKELADVEEQKAVGKARGEATAGLPGAYAEAQHVVSIVDDLINDPYLPNMVGPVNSRAPNVTTEAARVQSKMDQVAGQGFMAARQFLKGQGQITDFESKRAEQAMARMNAAQSYEDYVGALREFQDAVRVGVMKAEAAAGQGGAAPSPTPSGGWQDMGNGVRIREKQ